MSRPFNKPYTEIGISRMRCERAGCDKRAEFQWQCCAAGNRWARLCADCDVEINERMLTWFGDPDVVAKMEAYRIKVYGAPTILVDEEPALPDPIMRPINQLSDIILSADDPRLKQKRA